MKNIMKNPSPLFLDKWKLDYQQRYGRMAQYCDFIGEEKQKLREVLFEEQYGLCCYCCKDISFPYTNSIDCHIEHFRPQGLKAYKVLSLEYSNLHLSCSGTKNSRENCGHKKDNWFDESLTVSPLEKDVEELFAYTIDGHIYAKKGNVRADATIKQFNLDSFALQRLRKTAIYISGLFEDDFDEELRSQIIFEYSKPVEGKLRAFSNAVVYCVEIA